MRDLQAFGPGRSRSPAIRPRNCRDRRHTQVSPSSIPFVTVSNDLRIAVPALVVAVSDIVDPHPHREERVAARPRGEYWLARRLAHELVHLVDQRQHRRRVRLHERRVDSGAAIRVIVCQDQRLVVYRRVDIDPVRATDCRETLRRMDLIRRRVATARNGRERTGYGGFPSGFPGAGTAPGVVNPVWVYESPLESAAR